MRDEDLYAKRIVDAILFDLRDRRGLRQTWDGIDEDIRDEIKASWILRARLILESGADRREASR